MSEARVQYVKDKIDEDLESGELTNEEVMELGIWMSGKGLGRIWNEVFTGKPAD